MCLQDMEKELDKLRKQFDAQRKQLEDEMLSRVEAENKLQTVREELNLKEQVTSDSTETNVML